MPQWKPSASFNPRYFRALLDESKLPGMKVLEFAFDAREPSNYLPHTYDHHCVCYVGTHDNDLVSPSSQTVSQILPYIFV